MPYILTIRYRGEFWRKTTPNAVEADAAYAHMLSLFVDPHHEIEGLVEGDGIQLFHLPAGGDGETAADSESAAAELVRGYIVGSGHIPSVDATAFLNMAKPTPRDIRQSSNR